MFFGQLWNAITSFFARMHEAFARDLAGCYGQEDEWADWEDEGADWENELEGEGAGWEDDGDAGLPNPPSPVRPVSPDTPPRQRIRYIRYEPSAGSQ